MQLLEHFRELTLHPKNAEELKGLILQLAVQGKLTKKWREENPDVEPASVLLDKIENEKKQLIKAKKVKRETFDPLSESDLYFDIPNNWEWERLGNIGFIFNGDSINAGVKEALYSNVENGYPYIATKDVGYLFDPIDHENGIKIPFSESNFKIAEKGTVLICAEGGSAGKKMGILNQDCCFGNKLFAIKQFGGIESRFILSWYGSPAFGQVFRENMTGIIGGISRNAFANICIPIPPLTEQKAIVEVVNQLFTEVEQLEALTKERIQLKEDLVSSALNQLTQAAESDVANHWELVKSQFGTFFTEKSSIKKLREAILQIAVQGKLTRAFRESYPELCEGSNSAAALLEKIKAEKEQLIKAGKIKKEKPLPEITEEEIPYDLPEGWVWCRLGEIGFIQGGGTPSMAIRSYWNGNVPWICPKDMKRYYLDSSLNQITTEALEKSSAKLIKSDSILFVVRGMILAHSFPIGINKVPVAINQDMKALSPHLKGLEEFIATVLKGLKEITLSNVERSSHGTCKLQADFYFNLAIPLPPIEEQKAIVEKVNGLMALCDQLEQEIVTHHTTQEHWMQSCLREVV